MAAVAAIGNLVLSRTVRSLRAELEAEHREAAWRAAAARDAEALRIAQDLHDDIGHGLTAVLLSLRLAMRGAPGQDGARLLAAEDAARRCLDDVRRLSTELRPEALDDLGPTGALVALAERFSAETGLETECEIDAALPPLPPEGELVLYRVAQEALTNVARHARAGRAHIRVGGHEDGVFLRVRDDGLGRGRSGNGNGNGMRIARERAATVGGTLTTGAAAGGGAEVHLELPMLGRS